MVVEHSPFMGSGGRIEGEARLAVLLPLAVDGPFDYLACDDFVGGIGSFVEVPLGKRSLIGVVWAEGSKESLSGKLRPILRGLDIPPMPESLRKLIDWVSAYSMASLGLTLKMAMSVPSALTGESRLLLKKNPLQPENLRMTPQRSRALAAAVGAMAPSEIAREAGVSPAVLRALVEAGALLRTKGGAGGAVSAPDWRRPGPILSGDQEEAANRLRNASGFSVWLLEGVTGSGKTEVYFEALAQTLKEGRQILVLLPEIALSTQWLERFERRFGAPPALWHSDIGEAKRRSVWRGVASGEIRVVVGARSALFLPFPDLGLIVVDEEHDSSFKQEEGVIYNARDMAVVRARLSDAPIVLASATPSLESRVNADLGRYRHLRLPDRHGGALMPEMALIDMRKQPVSSRSWLSPPMVEALAATLEKGEQAMLFLNRRGYAPLTLCRSCGHRLRCPHCSAWLVEHRARQRLECHYCGYQRRIPESCPECGEKESFVACGPGVERLAEEAAARFPSAQIAIMASDTLSGPKAAQDIVEKMAARRIDFLVGTQIMAKGHHFPFLTLVGVIDADLGLAGGDLRASERTLQMLSQVSGRAGREDRPGRVLLQTWQPEHTVLQALISGEIERFYQEETKERRQALMPPFGRLAALIVSAPDQERADRAASALAREAPKGNGIEIWGPTPAPLAILRGRHRRRFLIRTGKNQSPQAVLSAWLEGVSLKGGVKLQIDVDPYSFT
ncbi:primosomal protein N' [Alphaproteobacteria bacterium]|nr:primosomal protein N' [Alphaproteobacteria bacterium]